MSKDTRPSLHGLFKQAVLAAPDKPTLWLKTCEVLSKLELLNIETQSFALELLPKDIDRKLCHIADILTNHPEYNNTVIQLTGNDESSHAVFMVSIYNKDYGYIDGSEYLFLELWKSEGKFLNISSITTNRNVSYSISNALRNKEA